MRSEFREITVSDIPIMADLLLSRQRLECDTFPFLQNSCLNEKYVTDVLEKLFMSSNLVGVGAFMDGELIGYIMGEITVDLLRGKHVWVPYEGMAVRTDQSSELIRMLYARVSAAWLEQDCFMHYAMVPLGNQAYFEAYLRLSFFLQQVHGVLNLEAYHAFPQVSDAEIRIADKGDREKMGRLSSIIQSYHNSAPVFELALPEVMADIKEGYESTVDNSDMTVLLAEKDGEELGFQIFEAATPSLMSPDDGVELSVAGTYARQMGTGIGKKLMNEGCTLMRGRGAGHIITDWRTTNLASSTFWTKCGFKPVAYRMVRTIDSNFYMRADKSETGGI